MTLSYRRLAAFLTLLAGLTGLSAVAQTGETGIDSLSIRRVNLSGEKLASALKNVEDGSLVRMSPADFDRLLVEARSDSLSVRPAPAVVEARYRAKYAAGPDGAGAFVGTAEWAVRRPLGSQPEVALEGL